MPIGRISFNVEGSLFIKELVRRRLLEFKSPTPIAYKLVVPEDLKWWYWLEFGTAGRQDGDAPIKTEHSGTYPIDPINGKMLLIPDAKSPNEPGGGRFTFHVDHPGIRPRLIYRGVRTEIIEYAKAAIAGGLRQYGINVAALRLTLANDILPYARDMMGKRLEEQAPGVKTSENNPFK
jgi:hypothetical protein